MAAPSAWTVVREILTADLNLSADDVIKKAVARGVTTPTPALRNTVHNVKSELKKQRAKSGGKPTPAAKPAAQAKPTPAAKPAATAARPATPAKPATPPAKPATPKPATAASSAPGPDLKRVFTNVALVNKVAGLSGGVDNARQVAEAVRACGSVEAFLQHLELVAGIQKGR